MKSQKQFISLHRNEDGSVLLMVLAVAAVLGVVVGVGASRVFANHTYYSNMRTLSTRNALNSNINKYINLPATFRTSIDPSLPAGTNTALRNCVLGGATCSATSQPVSLYYPVSGGGIQQLSGSAATPAYFDIQGNLCTAAQAKACPFQVVTSFTPSCGGAGSCSQATSISVNYVLTTTAMANSTFPLAAVNETSPGVSIAEIMPPSATVSNSNVNNSINIGSGGSNNSATVILNAIVTAGITDPAMVSTLTSSLAGNAGNAGAIVSAIVGAGITDTTIAGELASAGLTSVELDTVFSQMAGVSQGWVSSQTIQNIATAISGISNQAVQVGLANGWVQDASDAQTIANAVEASTSNSTLQEALAQSWVNNSSWGSSIVSAISGVSDPNVQAALAAAQITNPGQATAIASAIQGSGIDTSDPSNTGILQAIAGAAFTNSTQAAELASSGVTGTWNGYSVASNSDLTSDTTLKNTIISGGVTNSSVAQTIITDGITSAAVATVINNMGITNTQEASQIAATAATQGATQTWQVWTIAQNIDAQYNPPVTTTTTSSTSGTSVASNSGGGNSGSGGSDSTNTNSSSNLKTCTSGCGINSM
jgi:hypothetical protein